MWTIQSMFLVLALLLSGCRDDTLHLTLQVDALHGLQPGNAVLLENREVGKVTAVEAADDGGFLARLAIRPEFREKITRDAQFFVAGDPSEPGASQVEIVSGTPGGPPLSDGAKVRGVLKSQPLFPFGQIFRDLNQGLDILRDQVERFQSEIRRAPDSEEAQKLKDQWARLLEEIRKAQSSAEESMKKEVIPKLERELEELRKKFRELEPKPEPRKKPVET
jgi:hypothetical protein